MIVTSLFSRRWWWTTLLVLAAMVFMVGLGRWQLDRLAQRRALNAEVARQLAAEPVNLNTLAEPGTLSGLRHRQAEAYGVYDFKRQIVLKNQSYMGQPGVHLITPLRLQGRDEAILVDRGWIPYQEAVKEDWAQYHEAEEAAIRGYLQRSQKLPGGQTSPIPETPAPEWFRIDVEAIQPQMPYRLLPAYLLLAPEPGRAVDALPRRAENEVDLSEGSHMGYALQWFSFAAILGAGYIAYVRKHERESPPALSAEVGHRPLSDHPNVNAPS